MDNSMNSSPLDKARLKKTELEAAGLLRRLSPVEKARADPRSLRKAVTAFCYECVGGDDEPGARKEVTNCTAKGCHLYPIRPWQQNDEADGNE